MLNRVRPVRTTRIELTEDADRSLPTVVAVRGVVSLAHDGDRVRVVIEDRDQVALVDEVFTDNQGRFTARLDLVQLARLAGRAEDDLGGVYEVRAHTFAAATVAEASSNTVQVSR